MYSSVTSNTDRCSKFDTTLPVNCILVSGDEKFAGTVLLSSSELRLHLYGYDKYCSVPKNCPVTVRTIENKFVTLFETLTSLTGPRNFGNSFVSECIVDCKSAVSGYDIWHETDLVKSVSFMSKGADLLLINRQKLNRIHDKQLPDFEDIEIFSVRVGDLTIGASHSVSSSLGGLERHKIGVQYFVKFHNPVTIGEHIKIVHKYVGFLSFLSFKKLTPSNIKISRYDEQEISKLLSQKQNFPEHQFHHLTMRENSENIDEFIFHAPYASANSDSNVDHFIKCLEHWFLSDGGWQEAQMASFGLMGRQMTISSDRLLAACKLFETIPSARTVGGLPDEHIKEIISGAVEAAKRLSYEKDVIKRINGSLKKLSTESHVQQFRRLLINLRLRFGDSVLPDQIVSDLIAAIGFRGKSAHAPLEFTDDDVMLNFARATYALETLCYLLVLAEFPPSKGSDSRLSSLYPVENYKLLPLTI